MQEINLDWILTKVKNILRFVPDDGSVGQILRRTAHGAEWSNEQGGGGAVNSVNGQTGDVVLDATDVGALPDTTVIPTDTSDLTNGAGYVDAAGAAAAAPVQKVNGQTGTVTINKTSVGLGNVANVLQYSASNPPPYPVTSVNGQTGAVVLDADDVGALPDTYVAPVTSVNGQTGAVSLSIINPPDFINSVRALPMTSGTLHSFVSSGGWYQMRAVNRGTSGACWASICNSDQTAYYALADVGTGTYIRAITEWLYIPPNITVYARGEFTYPDQSGLFYAAPLS